MIFLVLLILSEVFSLVVLRQHFFIAARTRYYICVVCHLILSIWFWILYIDIAHHNSFFDTPDNVWRIMALTGMYFAVIIPRVFVIILHFTGKLFRRRAGGHVRWLTNTGLAFQVLVLVVTALGTFHGKLNFKYEHVPVYIKDLHPDLEGLKIVQISDLHMTGFYHHPDAIAEVIDSINKLEPDILLNTGDFVSIGWREFGRNDTILAKSVSKYGNYAVMGNHDAGTYHPDHTEADLKNHVRIMNNLVRASGYTVLNDEFTRLAIGNAVIGIIGITTAGRHHHIVHGDIETATAGLDSTDLNILLTHDPNHWLEEVSGKRPDILLSLSGHTHGMQMGIMTKKIRWSPSKYFYPHWNGLYSNGDQFHYVNRGLGVTGVPFRIWMPPEITILTLYKNS